MKEIHSIESAHVSGGWAPPWHGMYQSGLAKPCPDGGNNGGDNGAGSVPSGPGVNIRPRTGSGAYQPIVPGGEDNNGLG